MIHSGKSYPVCSYLRREDWGPTILQWRSPVLKPHGLHSFYSWENGLKKSLANVEGVWKDREHGREVWLQGDIGPSLIPSSGQNPVSRCWWWFVLCNCPAQGCCTARHPCHRHTPPSIEVLWRRRPPPVCAGFSSMLECSSPIVWWSALAWPLHPSAHERQLPLRRLSAAQLAEWVNMYGGWAPDGGTREKEIS